MHALAAIASQTSTIYSSVWDGVNDYLLRTTSLTGAANSDQISIVIWFKTTSSSVMTILSTAQISNTASAVALGVSGSRFFIDLRNAGGSLFAGQYNTNVADGDWHCMMISRSNSGTFSYLDDNVEPFSSGGTNTSGTLILIPSTNTAIASNYSPGQLFDGELGPIWIMFGTALDFSDVNVRRKFLKANGKPTNLGSDGSGPTGTQPILYFSGKAASYSTNKGSGGSFTLNGSITDGSIVSL